MSRTRRTLRRLKPSWTVSKAGNPPIPSTISCGGASACVEPIPANVYTHKTLSGAFVVRNPYLQDLLESKGQNTPEVWQSIVEHEGSVQHLDCLSDEDKSVYRTAFEIDQRWIIELAADRTPYICQSQSLNVFLPANVNKKDLHEIHMMAWKRGVKSMYYCRSRSVQRAESSFTKDIVKDAGQRSLDAAKTEPYLPMNELGQEPAAEKDYDECLSCQ